MGKIEVGAYDGITLNGVNRQGIELHDFCAKEIACNTTPEWLSHIYQFILQWLSSDMYITAKTSGSTGDPKPISLKKMHMIASAHNTIEHFQLKPEHTALLCLSANYIAGKMMIVRAFVGHFNLVLVAPDAQPFKGISQVIDFAALVPLQVSNSLHAFSTNGLVKTVIVGGGVVSEKLKRELVLSPVSFYETYGMTETVSHIAVRKIGDDTCFKAMPNVAFSLDDRHCLVIDAPEVSDHKLITNDIVDLQNHVSFLFKGRYDHVINSGGVKVSPEVVEKKMAKQLSIPFVISSVPDELFGEKVVLVVEKKYGIENLEFILSHMTEVTRFERPKQIIQINQFPLTQTLKINRTELKKQIIDLIR